MVDDEAPDVTFWREAVAALLAKGARPVEALEGANLLLLAYRRQRAQASPPASLRSRGLAGGVSRR